MIQIAEELANKVSCSFLALTEISMYAFVGISMCCLVLNGINRVESILLILCLSLVALSVLFKLIAFSCSLINKSINR